MAGCPNEKFVSRLKLNKFPAAANLAANFSVSSQAICTLCPKWADLPPKPGKLAGNIGNLPLKTIAMRELQRFSMRAR
jgi:hypothetical protein